MKLGLRIGLRGLLLIGGLIGTLINARMVAEAASSLVAQVSDTTVDSENTDDGAIADGELDDTDDGDLDDDELEDTDDGGDDDGELED